MKTSISEIKSFLSSRRNWYWSGRNAMYLREVDQSSSALRLGSAFHDALENMYQGNKVDTNVLIEKYKLADSDAKLLVHQLVQYKKIVLPQDLERYEIIEPELEYSIQLTPTTELFGFMDIVYRNRKTGQYGILEHKFVARPRADRYNELEEQVKTYELALRELVGDNVEGVTLNQVVKLEDGFQNIRTQHLMNENQQKHFRQKLIQTTNEMKEQAKNPIIPYSPHWAEVTFDPYYPLNKKMDLLGTDDTRVITEEDIKAAGLERKR